MDQIYSHIELHGFDVASGLAESLRNAISKALEGNPERSVISIIEGSCVHAVTKNQVCAIRIYIDFQAEVRPILDEIKKVLPMFNLKGIIVEVVRLSEILINMS